MSKFAARIERLSPSPIRDILHAASQPGMISFAGGLPAASTFPSFSATIDKHYLQYGPSEGEPQLREEIAANLQQQGIDADAEHILILSGSQQGIDLVAKLLVEPGTQVAVESPTYLAALQVFSLFGADYRPYSADALHDAFAGPVPRLLYTNPTFQNPTSQVYTKAQRLELAELCDRHDTILFEDDPYRELAYEPCDRRPVCADVVNAGWIYQSSFSKTLAPGIRLGYLASSPELFDKLRLLKQAADLHSCRISQRYALEQSRHPEAQQRLQVIREKYQGLRDAFAESLDRHFQDIARWSMPAGGLFFWLTLNGNTAIDTRELLPIALAQGVAFMPGEPFYADGRSYCNRFRLNFSHAESSEAERGLATLARVFRQASAQTRPAMV